MPEPIIFAAIYAVVSVAVGILIFYKAHKLEFRPFDEIFNGPMDAGAGFVFLLSVAFWPLTLLVMLFVFPAMAVADWYNTVCPWEEQEEKTAKKPKRELIPIPRAQCSHHDTCGHTPRGVVTQREGHSTTYLLEDGWGVTMRGYDSECPDPYLECPNCLAEIEKKLAEKEKTRQDNKHD